MTSDDRIQAARDCLKRAMDAHDQLRSALGEAITWLALANEPDNHDNDTNTDGRPAP